MTLQEKIRAVQQEIFDREDGRCGRCGDPMSFEPVRVERILPTSEGGDTSIYNTVGLHEGCRTSPDPDPEHVYRVAGCECPTCVVLQVLRERGEHVSPQDVYCSRCRATHGQHCYFPGRQLPDLDRIPRMLNAPFHAERHAIMGLGICPHCGAGKGWPCRSRDGQPTRPHLARLRAAAEPTPDAANDLYGVVPFDDEDGAG